MDEGKLHFTAVNDTLELIAKPVRNYLHSYAVSDNVWVARIDPQFSDTANFCEHYDIAMGISANCVIVEAKRADRVWYGACLVLATNRADINGIVRRQLD